MGKKFYLAYGSNLNKVRMKARCPGAEAVGTSIIPNAVLEFRGSGSGYYLTISRGDGTVPIGIWKVDGKDEKALDRYEGYPVFYHKEELTAPIKDIKTGKVKVGTCFAYVMNEGRPIGKPSASYLRTCLECYHEFGFSDAALLDAYRRSKGGERE